MIVGTIPSNLIHPYLPKEANTRYQEVHKLTRENRYLEARNLGEKILAETAGRHQASLFENLILRKLANKFKLPIADVYQAVSDAEPHHIPGETLFNDHCHLNEKGNELLLQTFFDKIDVEKVPEIRVVP